MKIIMPLKINEEKNLGKEEELYIAINSIKENGVEIKVGDQDICTLYFHIDLSHNEKFFEILTPNRIDYIILKNEEIIKSINNVSKEEIV